MSDGEIVSIILMMLTVVLLFCVYLYRAVSKPQYFVRWELIHYEQVSDLRVNQIFGLTEVDRHNIHGDSSADYAQILSYPETSFAHSKTLTVNLHGADGKVLRKNVKLELRSGRNSYRMVMADYLGREYRIG